MKQIYTLIAILFITFSAAAQSRTLITFTASSGDWSKASNWSLNRIPQSNDSIVIPQSKSVSFDKPDTLANVYIKVMGVLTIQKKMRLSITSVIELSATGSIKADGAQRNVEQVTIDGVLKYDENAPAIQSGLGYASKASGISPNGFNLSILPVVFNSFYITRNNNNVILNWSTAQELNNNSFEVQRSFDGSNWSVMAIVLGAGNSNTVQQYSFTDKNMTAGVAYYRIRQVDMNGQFEYTTTKSIKATEAAPATRIYASNNTVNIEFNKEVKNPITIRIISMNGQVKAQRDQQQAAYRITMPVNNLKGVYVVQLNDNAGWNEVRKVIF
ncbi:hypothetical protein A3860_10980 [Niastella vici]|uniref:Uncharacterized protein n=1 Tax=Niastella vici TaxID=1703345 RepID=A0A1V9FFD9_9BACT|nr:T9SS type A sorting domain-containing protein [Niastella vici]OQP57082.1 hypothetical protein A3860_10980 [Niastella vici]